MLVAVVPNESKLRRLLLAPLIKLRRLLRRLAARCNVLLLPNEGGDGELFLFTLEGGDGVLFSAVVLVVTKRGGLVVVVIMSFVVAAVKRSLTGG